ncbi:MAG TPA: class I SAM-dependent methyltransferase [Pseudomonadales bacterium]|nr:class I SAM-dependent methyltransferase [Pseudomonadales bacterium]
MAAKQRKAFGLTVLDARHPKVRKLRRDGHVAEIHGNKIWDSSFLVMDHLKRHPLPKRTRVLDIGCGWGLLGLFCAKRFGNRVHGIDADRNVLPYLELHAEVNGVRMTAERKTFKKLTVDYLSNFDVVMGADICFWDDMTGELYNLIKRARRAGVKQVIVADPQRSPFTALAVRCEKKFKKVERIKKSIKRPVEAHGELLIVR